MVPSTELGPSWETPAAEICYSRAKKHTLGEGRAASALLLNPLQKESHPILPTNHARQGRGKRLHAKNWCLQETAELPGLQLQVQHELQSREYQASTGMVSFLHLPPFFSFPTL